MLVKIAIALVVLVVLFVAYVASRPAEFSLSREIKIAASPETIFPFANDAHLFNSWNPWMKADPQVKVSFSGPAAGVGAITAWEGNSQIGVGQAEVVASEAPKLVRTRLDYEKPFKGTQMAEFTLRSEGSDTVVTWSISGKSALMPRILCALMFLDMNKIVGGAFETGLAELKAKAEAKK